MQMAHDVALDEAAFRLRFNIMISTCDVSNKHPATAPAPVPASEEDGTIPATIDLPTEIDLDDHMGDPSTESGGQGKAKKKGKEKGKGKENGEGKEKKGKEEARTEADGTQDQATEAEVVDRARERYVRHVGTPNLRVFRWEGQASEQVSSRNECNRRTKDQWISGPAVNVPPLTPKLLLQNLPKVLLYSYFYVLYSLTLPPPHHQYRGQLFNGTAMVDYLKRVGGNQVGLLVERILILSSTLKS